MPARLAVLGSLLPAGERLPRETWEPRHRWIVRLLVLHIPALAIFSLARGNSVPHTLLEVTPLVTLGWWASRDDLDMRTRACLASVGLMTASAVLVHLGDGRTEMHFHFFVMLPVISLYHDWRPFLLSIAFVAVHHGVVGVLSPKSVFDHSGAWREPVLWAGIHAAFVLAASAVCVLSWRLIEDSNRAARAELEASERRFRSLVEQATDVVSVLDAAGAILYDSPSVERVLGYSAAERLGTRFQAAVHPDDLDQVLAVVRQIVAEGGITKGMELRVRHRDGSFRWIEAVVTNLLTEPGIEGLVANFREITERKVLEQELSHQAFHDSLTGLANRALLLDRVEHALQRRSAREGDGLALLFLDIDDFKTVNDGLGHEVGDRILRVTADRIASVLRPGDTASRLGGDEFAVVLERLSSATVAYDIGGRLLEAVALPIDIDGLLVAVHASLGIAVSDGTEDSAALLRNADLAMYRAKAGGKGRFEVYEAGMHATVLERMALKADLARAVEAGEFQPHYQPIVHLATGAITGVEALARWQHPEQGLVAPATFIPLAEETGVIVAIGSHMLLQACRDLAAWRAELLERAPETMSVNLSPRQLQQHDIVAEVTEVLADVGLPASCLILEITEGILLEQSDSVATALAGLKALGVRIALDDFGTGYSSLSYLDKFPVDIVKIDKSFIESLGPNDATPSPLVSAIVNLGAVLGLGVTAEGIEDANQLARLKEMGCETGQGFLFSKPLSAPALTQFLTTSSIYA